jgi:hypothetical protein
MMPYLGYLNTRHLTLNIQKNTIEPCLGDGAYLKRRKRKTN